MSRPNLEEIYGRLETLKCAGSTLYRDDLEALLPYIADLEEEIDDLKIKAREAEAWEGRYNALLEECEAGRPRVIDGGEASRGAASMTVALDVNGYPWLCYEGGWWRLVKDIVQGKCDELHPILAPYTIVYTPGWAKWPRGRDSRLATTRSFLFA